MKTNEELEEEIRQLKHELTELRLQLLQAPAYILMPYPVPQYPQWIPQQPWPGNPPWVCQSSGTGINQDAPFKA